MRYDRLLAPILGTEHDRCTHFEQASWERRWMLKIPPVAPGRQTLA